MSIALSVVTIFGIIQMAGVDTSRANETNMKSIRTKKLKSKPMAIKTVGQALKIIANIKKKIPKEQRVGMFLVMKPRVMKRLMKLSRGKTIPIKNGVMDTFNGYDTTTPIKAGKFVL